MEKRLLLIFVALLTVIGSFAQGKYVTVDGLKYFLRSDSKEAILFANSYSGDITVPEKITDEGVEYTVTAFADDCFKECESLTSVTIPSSVTSLGDYCFFYCSSLTNITIPSSVTSLGSSCFSACKSLTSITIPSSVTSLSENCFRDCRSLTSITIPSSVTSLGEACFYDCYGLTRITIPSSVTSLGLDCFRDCRSLTSITIPSSVTSLGLDCFSGCTNLTNITCKNPTPPSLASDAFDNNTCLVSTLYVPDVNAYKSAKGWKNFKYIKEITSGGDDKTGEPCAMPTIGYADGHLKFTDTTEGAKYHCTLTCSDVQSDKLYEDGDVSLAACYDISVYATADGFKPSDKATAKLYWVKADGNLTTDNINTSKMRGVVVTSDGGIVAVSGLSDGEKVEFYTTDGKLIGSQKTVSGSASIATSEQIVICKVGNSSIKIIVK